MTERAVHVAAGAPAGTRPRTIFSREPDLQLSLALILQVIFLFISVPAFGSGKTGLETITTLQLVQAIVSIVLLVKAPLARIIFAISFGATMLGRILPGQLPHGTALGMTFLYNLTLIFAVARAVFGAGAVNHHRIAGAVFIYLNIALLFAVGFSLLVLIDSGSLHGLSADRPYDGAALLHLSFTTLTAIGNSPVTAQSPFAHSLSDLETIIGQLFPAILLSRLVGLHLTRPADHPTQG